MKSTQIDFPCNKDGKNMKEPVFQGNPILCSDGSNIHRGSKEGVVLQAFQVPLQLQLLSEGL